jgi:hypothetical protein
MNEIPTLAPKAPPKTVAQVEYQKRGCLGKFFGHIGDMEAKNPPPGCIGTFSRVIDRFDSPLNSNIRDDGELQVLKLKSECQTALQQGLEKEAYAALDKIGEMAAVEGKNREAAWKALSELYIENLGGNMAAAELAHDAFARWLSSTSEADDAARAVRILMDVSADGMEPMQKLSLIEKLLIGFLNPQELLQPEAHLARCETLLEMLEKQLRTVGRVKIGINGLANGEKRLAMKNTRNIIPAIKESIGYLREKGELPGEEIALIKIRLMGEK